MDIFVISLIVFLIYGLILGFITKYVAESKGYDGGFWWGFFLGVIGLLVVGFRPDNRQQYQTHSSSQLPAWASSPTPSSTPSSTSLFVASLTGEPDWTCICGAKNPATIDYCLACRRSKSEGNIPKKVCPHCGANNRATNTLCFACDKPLDGSQPTRRRNPDNRVSFGEEESTDYVAVLEKLAKLHEQGILTDEEFQQKKADLLAKI